MSLYRARKKPTDMGKLQTQHARQVALSVGETTNIIDYVTEPNLSWSLYLFANDPDGGDITIIQEQRGSGFGTTGAIKYSIGGYENGQLVSGTGSVTLKAIANGRNNLLSVYFVEQVYDLIIPSFSQNLVIDSSPTYQNVGYPPFNRNKCNILSNSNFTVRLVNSDGDTVIQKSLTPPSLFNNNQGFFHPSILQLQILNSVASQKFCITHY